MDASRTKRLKENELEDKTKECDDEAEGYK